MALGKKPRCLPIKSCGSAWGELGHGTQHGVSPGCRQDQCLFQLFSWSCYAWQDHDTTSSALSPSETWCGVETSGILCPLGYVLLSEQLSPSSSISTCWVAFLTLANSQAAAQTACRQLEGGDPHPQSRVPCHGTGNWSSEHLRLEAQLCGGTM